MYFVSYEFIGFVILICLLYYIVPKKMQRYVLVFASMSFIYYIESVAFLVVLLSSASLYIGGLLIKNAYDSQKDCLRANAGNLTKEEKQKVKKNCERKRFVILAFCISFNLLMLVLFKYTKVTPFTVLGISYFTLRGIGYLIDCNRKTIEPEKNFDRLLLYISFFPLMLQGPLTDYSKLTDDLYKEHAFEAENIGKGALRITWGFFKKLVIADRVFVAVQAMVNNEASYRGAWVFLSMALYTLELYADFTGGIDIALGVSKLFGIKVQENFDRPFFSTSLKEYWRRWHITMCEWFRNYLFYPLSVCIPIKCLLRFCKKHFGEKAGKRIPVYVASACVWFVTGVWHGAAWNFIVWAMCHFMLLMISEELEPLYRRFHEKCSWAASFPYRIFMRIRTVFIVSLLMQFDIFTDVKTQFMRIVSLLGIGVDRGALLSLSDGMNLLGLLTRDWIIILAGAVLLFLVSLIKGEGSFLDKLWKKPYFVRFATFAFIFTAVLLFGVYGPGYDSEAFIYTRF